MYMISVLEMESIHARLWYEMNQPFGRPFLGSRDRDETFYVCPVIPNLIALLRPPPQ